MSSLEITSTFACEYAADITISFVCSCVCYSYGRWYVRPIPAEGILPFPFVVVERMETNPDYILLGLVRVRKFRYTIPRCTTRLLNNRREFLPIFGVVL
jgi:hypothetical protein